MKITNYLFIGFIFLFAFKSRGQEVKPKHMFLQEISTEAERNYFERLIDGIDASVFFLNLTSDLTDQEAPVKVYVDLDGLGNLYNPVFNASTVEIIIFRIDLAKLNNQQVLLDSLNQFSRLRHFHLILENGCEDYDCVNQLISNLFKGTPAERWSFSFSTEQAN